MKSNIYRCNVIPLAYIAKTHTTQDKCPLLTPRMNSQRVRSLSDAVLFPEKLACLTQVARHEVRLPVRLRSRGFNPLRALSIAADAEHWRDLELFPFLRQYKLMCALDSLRKDRAHIRLFVPYPRDCREWAHVSLHAPGVKQGVTGGEATTSGVVVEVDSTPNVIHNGETWAGCH